MRKVGVNKAPLVRGSRNWRADAARLRAENIQDEGVHSRGRGEHGGMRDEAADSAVKVGDSLVPRGKSLEKRHQGRPLNFGDLLHLAKETTEPSEIIRRLSSEEYGLKQLLASNPKWDVQELVLVVVGGFCQKQGVSQFQTGFIKVAQILAEAGIFQQAKTIIMMLPDSRSTNMPPKVQRLESLVKSINHLAVDILVTIPNFGCNYLGKHFFRDLISLQNMPSIADLDSKESIFNIFNESAKILRV